jgi:hypothetical protein
LFNHIESSLFPVVHAPAPLLFAMTSLKQGVEKLLRCPSAALRGARFLAYLLDMSQSLCAARLAYGHPRYVFNTLLNPI